MARRMPELMTEWMAAVVLGSDKRRPRRSQRLACGTIYLAADVRELASGMLAPMRRRMPELMGAKEAAAHLGVKGPNLYKMAGVSDVPRQRTAHGTIYLADGIRALKEDREAGRPERNCAKHGDEDMRTGASGKRYCAVCNRERKQALLSDSVRREAYNRRRRERYREQHPEQPKTEAVA